MIEFKPAGRQQACRPACACGVPLSTVDHASKPCEPRAAPARVHKGELATPAPFAFNPSAFTSDLAHPIPFTSIQIDR